MATPQRPLPGGYIATPAPRPPAYRMSSASSSSSRPGLPSLPVQPVNGTSQNAVAGAVPEVRLLTDVERAARGINSKLAMEARYPPLEDYATQGISGEYDIPPQSAQSQIPSPWAPFQKVKTYEIPERVFEQYNTAEVNTSMGLFAELHHAWIAIDNTIYLWDYTHPNPDQTELIGYEELNESITAVQLVRPRAGVFVASITHLLVVTTADSLYLIGLASTSTLQGVTTVELYQTGMNASIKGINVSCIAGSSKTGRIFIGSGNTNDVYEITYQQEEKWFSSKCGKICHTDSASIMPKSFSVTDLLGLGSSQSASERVKQIVMDDSRDLLYTLSSCSTIRVFHIKPGQGLPLIITLTTKAMIDSIGHMIRKPLEPLLKPEPTLVSLCPISSAESSRLNLMVTTSTGVRIFTSATPNSYYGNGSNSLPQSMQAHHVRFPPLEVGNSASSPSTSSSQHLASYQQGVHCETTSKALITTRISRRFAPGYCFHFVHTEDADGKIIGPDNLLITAPETGRIAKALDPGQSRRYIEAGQWISLTGRTEDLGLVSTSFTAARSSEGFGNELAVQFDQTASEVAILTNTGIHTIRRRRLVDIFASTIRSSDGFEETVKKFVRLYGRVETCATAIAVACGQSMDVTADARIANITDPDVIELARKAFIEHGGKPMLNENTDIGANGSSIDHVQPSPRANGLMLYISRLVRSLWKEPLLKECHTPTGGLLVTSTVPLTKLQTIQHDLTHLKEFLDANKSFIEGLDGPDALRSVASRQDEIILQGEHRILTALVKTVDNIIEGIAFVTVLFDDSVDEIILSLSDVSRKAAHGLTYEGLFCSHNGRDLAKELVKAIVNRSISRGANVDTVAEALRRRCGSFCSADDVVVFKAQEYLRKASEAGADSSSGRLLLNDSLDLFRKVAGSLSYENLARAVDQYIAMSFYGGATRLALTVAEQRDGANKALSWIKDGRPDLDSRQAAYNRRTECYKQITKVIEAVDRDSSASQNADDMRSALIAKRRAEAYLEINSSHDEVFQAYLFDWYLRQGWSDRLLDIDSPNVISYLQRKSKTDAAHAELLWRYYARYNNFFEAAKVQLELAKSDFALDLPSRVGLLSRAKANASTRTHGLQEFGRSRQTKQEVIREINDLLDLANIQQDLLQRLVDDARLPPEKKAEVSSEMNGKVLPLDSLYNNYADQASYYDICLVIYELADYRNAANIKSTWTNLINALDNEARRTNQAQAFEIVSEKVRELGRRLNCSDNTFPIPVLLPILIEWAIENSSRNNRQTLETWPVELFLDLGISHEVLVTILEDLFYNPEAPWNADKTRGKIAQLLIYTIDSWFTATTKTGGIAFGSEENAVAMLEMCRMVVSWGRLGREAQREAERVRDAVDRALW